MGDRPLSCSRAMREQLRVVLAVARDPTLARIELAYLGFNMAEHATWIAILVYAYGLGGAGSAAIVALIQLVPSGLVAPFAAYAGDRYPRDRVLLAGYLLQAASCAGTATALLAGWSPAITIALATMASASMTITRPTVSVILPGITHAPGDLTAANAVSGLVENGAHSSGRWPAASSSPDRAPARSSPSLLPSRSRGCATRCPIADASSSGPRPRPEGAS